MYCRLCSVGVAWSLPRLSHWLMRLRDTVRPYRFSSLAASLGVPVICTCHSLSSRAALIAGAAHSVWQPWHVADSASGVPVSMLWQFGQVPRIMSSSSGVRACSSHLVMCCRLFFVVMHSVPVYCLVLKPAGLVLPVFTSWHCLHRPRPNFGSLGLSRMSMSSVLSYG